MPGVGDINGELLAMADVVMDGVRLTLGLAEANTNRVVLLDALGEEEGI